MKKIKTFTLALVVFMSISSVAVSAESPDTNFTDIEVGTVESAVSYDAIFEELKSDFEIIDQIEEDSAQEFYENNTDWIEDVNSKLENYLAAYPESERSGIIAKLMNINPMSRAYWGNFNWYNQGMRGGYWSFNMSPKMSTRLLRSVAEEGWNEIARSYNLHGNQSLYNQYMCHFDAFIESEWNIEAGRPNVSYAETIRKLCNP